MAFHSAANFASLPRQLQEYIVQTYLGDSYARLSYLNTIFQGHEYYDMRVLIADSFEPTNARLHFNEGVAEDLNISTAESGYQRLSISRIVNVSGQSSGLTHSVFRLVGDHTDWLQGSLLLKLPCYLGWMQVAEYTSRTTAWDFKIEDFFEAMAEFEYSD